MKASNITTQSRHIAVVGYDKNGTLIMWGTAKHFDVIKIELTDTTMKVYVDYTSGEY